MTPVEDIGAGDPGGLDAEMVVQGPDSAHGFPPGFIQMAGQKSADVFRLFLDQGIQTRAGEIPEDGGGDGMREQIVVKIVCERGRFCLKDIPITVDEAKVRILQAEEVGERTGGHA